MEDTIKMAPIDPYYMVVNSRENCAGYLAKLDTIFSPVGGVLITTDIKKHWEHGSVAYLVWPGEVIGSSTDKKDYFVDQVVVIREMEDEDLAEHNIFLSGEYVVENSQFFAYGTAQVIAVDSTGVAMGTARVYMHGDSFVTLYGKAHATLYDCSRGVAYGRSSMDCKDHSGGVYHDDSTGTSSDQATVDACGPNVRVTCESQRFFSQADSVALVKSEKTLMGMGAK